MRKLVADTLLILANMVRPRVRPTHVLKQALMEYQHPMLIKQLELELDIGHGDAMKVFELVKMYLYSVAFASSEEAVSPPTDLVDKAWHNFMLFSADYERFCMHFFGFFIHHQPITEVQWGTRFEDGAGRAKRMILAEFGCDFYGGDREAFLAGNNSAARCGACIKPPQIGRYATNVPIL